MSHDDLLGFLRSTTLLAGLPDAALQSIAVRMRTVEVPAGTVVFEEGAPGDAAYLILDGELGLCSQGVELVRRGPGGLVGEFSLIDGGPRSTSGIARSALRMVAWDRDAFHQTLASDPEVASAILKTLTAKLRGDVRVGAGLIAERDRWREDLARSREVQAAMLPEEQARVPGLDVAGRCEPAGAVGGDFYDVLPFADGRVALIIADVTGHGLHSGLIVAMVKSCLHTQARFDASPRAMITALRETLDLSLDRGMLMSCVYGLFDPAAGRLSYGNAGHPHPLLWESRAARVVALEVLDPILGAQDPGEHAYQERDVPWQPGDRLVLCSDGLLEARSPRGEEFGRGRLAGAIAALPDGDALATRDALLEAVEAHCAGAALRDDLTLVVVHAGTDGSR